MRTERIVPEPGMPDMATRSRFDLGTSWNFSQVFCTSRSTSSSIIFLLLKFLAPVVLVLLRLLKYVITVVENAASRLSLIGKAELGNQEHLSVAFMTKTV